jgi:hypothetical protein
MDGMSASAVFLAIVHIHKLHHSNLCAHEWLAHNKTGSAAEFKTYYDGLSDGQKKVRLLSHLSSAWTNIFNQSYNELAAKKVCTMT